MRRRARSTDDRDMTTDAGSSRETATSEQWRTLLTEGHGALVRARRVFRHLPAEPRCKVCGNPFGGVAGHVLAAAGFSPSRKNPNLCTRCCDALPPGGAEVDVAVLFADVRGSTALAERAEPTDVAALLNRFYFVATRALLRYDAVIDKLIGDEVMALFVPGISGAEYRRRAVEAGLALLHAVGYGSLEGPWIELGEAVNAGIAYVGNIGTAVVDFTAIGDAVNVAARMQQLAAEGELLVSAGVADDISAHAPRRTLKLRGREQPIDAFVLTNPSREAPCNQRESHHRRQS
jgi:adenylate cyclase